MRGPLIIRAPLDCVRQLRQVGSKDGPRDAESAGHERVRDRIWYIIFLFILLVSYWIYTYISDYWLQALRGRRCAVPRTMTNSYLPWTVATGQVVRASAIPNHPRRLLQRLLFGAGITRLKTRTNNAGGTLGGISNGEDLFFRVAVKPVSTIGQAQATSTYSGESTVLEAKGESTLLRTIMLCCHA
eukprot:SAG31_NODE_2915_length_4917_cov_3.609381_3_plen_186_part_00